MQKYLATKKPHGIYTSVSTFDMLREEYKFAQTLIIMIKPTDAYGQKNWKKFRKMKYSSNGRIMARFLVNFNAVIALNKKNGITHFHLFLMKTKLSQDKLAV